MERLGHGAGDGAPSGAAERSWPLSAHLLRLIAISILPALVVALWLAVDRVRSEQEETRVGAEWSVRAYADRVDAFLDARIRALRILADSPLADDAARWGDLYEEALGFLSGFGSHVIFADAERQMLFNTRTPFGAELPRLPDSPGRTAAVVALETGKAAVGDIVQGPVADQELVAIAVPGLRDGAVRWLMLATTTSAEFRANLEHAALPAGWAMALLDGTGRRIAGKGPPEHDSARDVDPAWRFDTALTLAPWTLVVEVPRAVQRATHARTVPTMLLAVAVATLGGIVGGTSFARRIARDVRALGQVGGPHPVGMRISEFVLARRRIDEGVARLREGDTRLRLAMSAANVGLWDWDLRTNRVAYSPEWKHQLGHTEDEVEDDFEEWERRVHPDDLAPALEAIRSYIAEPRGRHRTEVRLRHADGSYRWILALADVVRDASGTPIRMLGCHVDVSERRAAEDALRDSHRVLTKVLENEAVGVMIWDLSTGTLTQANDTFLDLMGYDRADVDAGTLTWQRLTPPEHVEASLAEIARLAETGRIGPYEKEHLRSDGSRRWLLFAGSSLGGDACVGFCVDIGDRKSAEEALRRETDFTQATLASVPGVLVCVDASLVPQRWNDNFERVTGYAAHEIARMTAGDFFGADDRRAVAMWARTPVEAGVIDAEVDLVARDGTRTPYRFTVAGAELDGRPHLVGVGIDIAEQRRAEAALRQAASVFENANEAIMITDRDGTIVDVNDAFVRITGFGREEAVGSNPRILKSGVHPGGFYDEMWRTLRERGTWSGEVWNRRKSGERYAELLTISAIRDAEGQPHRYVALFSDITAMKDQQSALERLVASRTHALLAAKEEAEQANRAKSTFLASMSHELRTPMNGVLGMIGLARRRIDDAQAARFLDKAEGSARHLLALLNDLLDLAKIEAGRVTIEHRPLTVAAVVDDVVALLGHVAEDRGLTLTREVEAALANRALLGDPLRVTQVLINLVSNAIKFSHRGEIRVVAQVVEDAADVLVRFEVHDQGVGVAHDAQERLFDAFEQVDPAVSGVRGGTGLGLAISKRLALLMGGDIGLESTPAVGSLFWFTTRLGHLRNEVGAPPSDADRGPSDEERLRRDHAGARILIAEDEPINREILGHQLSHAGLDFDEASDGVEASMLARRRRYDAILMDMQMPNADGLEATRTIRADSLNRDTPIVAMTANVFEEDRQRCFEAGMDDHLAKPVPPPMLYAALRTWLDRSRARRTAAASPLAAGGDPDSSLG